MIKINRNNYENYFLDYIEGRLNQSDSLEVQNFLLQNPDLEEELTSFEDIKLTPLQIEFPGKENLKKTEYSDLESRFDEFCIAYIENDMPPGYRETFEEYIKIYPDKRIIYESYLRTRLVPDERIVFANKKGLKHYRILPSARIMYLATSVAAMFILFYSLFTLFLKQPLNDSKITYIIKEEKKTDTVSPHQSSPPDQLVPKNQVKNKTKKDEPKNQADKHIKPVLRQKSSTVKNLNDLSPLMSMHREQVPVVLKGKEPLVFSKKQDDKNKLLMASNDMRKQQNQQKENSGYLTLKQAVSQKLIENLTDKKELPKQEKMGLWFFAEAGIEKLNKTTGTNIRLQNKYDTDGNLQVFAINSGVFEFSTKVNKEK